MKRFKECRMLMRRSLRSLQQLEWVVFDFKEQQRNNEAQKKDIDEKIYKRAHNEMFQMDTWHFFCSFVSLSFPLSILLYAVSYNKYLSSLNF